LVSSATSPEKNLFFKEGGEAQCSRKVNGQKKPGEGVAPGSTNGTRYPLHRENKKVALNTCRESSEREQNKRKGGKRDQSFKKMGIGIQRLRSSKKKGNNRRCLC